jgi:hypothetical protein
MPPVGMKGKLSGIYFRPRFLTERDFSIGNMLKAAGFRRLCSQGWFRSMYFVDEFLFSSFNDNLKKVFHFLPDPWSGDFSCSKQEARKILNIPGEKFVFLQFGIGSLPHHDHVRPRER